MWVGYGPVLFKDKHGFSHVEAECACGTKKVVRLDHLLSGRSRSCGCISKIFASTILKNLNTIHGHTPSHETTRTYNTWRCMVRRCTQPTNIGWNRYSGRGIKVTERWLKFKDFLGDMGERPEGMTLDRINNDGNYEPGNCRWATPKLQRANQSVSF